MATLLTGFTGYSLVFEQLSYWGATVAANISDAVPLVGGFAKRMLLGGDEYNARTLSRFYILHAAVLPTTIILLVVCHIAQVQMHGVTEFPDPQAPPNQPRHFNFYPDHMLSELIIGLVLMIVLCALATILPATMGPKADPLTTPEIIKPDCSSTCRFAGSSCSRSRSRSSVPDSSSGQCSSGLGSISS